MSQQRSVRVVVIGGGPAGYVAAIRASQLSAEVALIERNALGGVCANRGCIPTKTLLSYVSLVKKLKSFNRKSILLDTPKTDVSKLFDWRDSVISKLQAGLEYLMRKNGVEVIRGSARRVRASAVEVVLHDGSIRELKYDKLIVATGSSPLIPQIPGIEDVPHAGGDDIVASRSIPSRVLILGGGAIGVEVAQILSNLGAKVFVVEIIDRVLPFMDREVSQLIQRKLAEDGVTIYTGTTVSKFERRNGEAVAHLTNGIRVEVDFVVAAVGRKPNSRGLGLEELGVKLGRRGEIVADEAMWTGVPGVYTAGDVVGKYFLAYTAMEEGYVAAENALSGNRRMNYEAVPVAVFTDPEAACVGLTEEEARSRYGEVLVGRFPLIANGRALTLDSYDGFVKIVADRNGRLLGAHVVGPEASELIHILAMMIRRGFTLNDLLDMYYIHPTLSEAVKDAALAALGRPIHI